MLLTITSTAPPATDLGYLLHKNPAKVQTYPLTFGAAHVYYPEATAERCTAALLLDVDPVGLVRDRKGPGGEGGRFDQYVNDRPYVASSFLSVAIAQVYGSALNGRSKDRPELTEMPLPLTARLAAVPCRGGEGFLRRLFEPLGYAVTTKHHPLDEQFPEWGDGPYYTVELAGTVRLYELLSHLYVLIPVLDNDKHYWVSEAEVEKLLRHGEGWLAAHPERERISERYLRRQRKLVNAALSQLIADVEPAEDESETTAPELVLEQKLSLNEHRHRTVLAAVKETGARRVIDLGCGEGKLLRLLLEEPQFLEVVGMDVSTRSLAIAEERLRRTRHYDGPGRLKVLHGSLMYRDARLAGFDAAVAVEVIEHLDPPRLSAFERVVFEFARPNTVVLTTPNVEYNVKFAGLSPGKFRHRDHRFEWTRAELMTWATAVGDRHGYRVTFAGVGEEDPVVGSPTQMATFRWGR
ncbi:MAG TPA: 3' terminal RNA ribose 2'-O-methyltransferase Hen1 [Gemmataceae bacterium]|nr:3' terminal RNA ribose 2'-O-methyltransferase Hen1 [Gemmataceae bacterium]